METVISSASKQVTIGPDNPFVIIGERINPTGCKLLTAQMFDMNMDLVRGEAIRQRESSG